MGARALLADLAAGGMTVEAAGDKLLIRPASKLTDELRAALRAAKPELLALLAAGRSTAADSPDSPSVPEALIRRGPAWSEAEVATFVARVALFMRRGVTGAEADSLAERLTLRDRDGDDRRACLECRHLQRNGGCAMARAGRLRGVDLRFTPLPKMLMRCSGFEESTC